MLRTCMRDVLDPPPPPPLTPSTQPPLPPPLPYSTLILFALPCISSLAAATAALQATATLSSSSSSSSPSPSPRARCCFSLWVSLLAQFGLPRLVLFSPRLPLRRRLILVPRRLRIRLILRRCVQRRLRRLPLRRRVVRLLRFLDLLRYPPLPANCLQLCVAAPAPMEHRLPGDGAQAHEQASAVERVAGVDAVVQAHDAVPHVEQASCQDVGALNLAGATGLLRRTAEAGGVLHDDAHEEVTRPPGSAGWGL